jgi:colanic acid/amylovoran biosynthesis glycosyltransferase
MNYNYFFKQFKYMIIGQVLDKFLPISEPWIYSQIKGLENIGINSKIFCHKIINTDSFHHNHIYSYKDLPAWKIYAYKLKGLIAKQDAATIYWNNILKKEKVDLIHSHFGWAAFKGIDLAIKNNLPHIVTFYGSDVILYPFLENDLGKKYKAKLPLIFEKSEIILCTSRFLEQKLLKLGAPQGKIEVWRPGINLSLFKKNKNNFNNKTIKIISVGRFNEFKGQMFLLKALEIINNKFSNVKTTFIGEGHNLSNCKNYALKHNLNNNVKFINRLEQKNVAKIMSESDIFILPSTISKDRRTESLGVVLVEAGACGLPLIGSNVGGIPEIVINNKTGLLFEEKNYRQLADAIIKLISNYSLRKELGGNAEKYIKNEFDINKQIVKLKNVYNKSMGQGLK